MTKFNIATHKFELDNEEYFLKPLGGAYVGLLFEVLDSFQSVNTKVENETPKDITDAEKEKFASDKFLSYLDKEALGKLHTLTLETFKRSYPTAKEEELEGFVTQNLFTLMSHIIAVNMGKTED